VDIVSLDGFECAGHPGEADVGNLVLQAKGARALGGKTPFVASGGVGNGAQLAACLALGADGVNLGTRFCATVECAWPEAFKARMVAASEEDTVLMFRRLHNTARVIRNKVSNAVEKIELEKGGAIQFSDLQDLVRGSRGREAEKLGDPDGGIWTAGQVIGVIDDIPTCRELIDRMVAEAEETVSGRLSAMLRARPRL